MHNSLLNLLDSSKNWSLKSESAKGVNDEILSGTLCCGDGEEAEIKNGVPSFYKDGTGNEEQSKTNETFSAKWNVYMRGNNDSTHRYMLDFVLKRLVPLGVTSEDEYKEFLKSKKRILDAGSGNGWMSEFMARNTDGTVVSAEIGDGVYAGYEKCKDLDNCHVIKADLMDLPFENEFFDFIFSDGVLHHTPDTKLAMKSLYDKLERGGGVLVLHI